MAAQTKRETVRVTTEGTNDLAVASCNTALIQQIGKWYKEKTGNKYYEDNKFENHFIKHKIILDCARKHTSLEDPDDWMQVLSDKLFELGCTPISIIKNESSASLWFYKEIPAN